MPNKKPKPANDHLLRRSYLEAYAARDARKRLSRLNTEVGIRQETLDKWMQQADFLAELKQIDDRRMESALMIAKTMWPRIMEEQAAIAAGVPEEPPDLSGRDPEQVRFLLAAYRARAARRMVMTTRAAELVAKCLGAIVNAPTVSIHAENVDTFGHLPSTRKELIKENKRLDEILKRAQELDGDDDIIP